MHQIIYFNSAPDSGLGSISNDKIDQIETETNSIFVQVDAWFDLINAMYNQVALTSTTLVLFDKSKLELQGTTINEIASAMSTMGAVTGKQKIMLGIVARDKCEPALVQYLKKSNVNGIVPSYKEFGLADFLDAINNLLSGHLHWPESCITPKVKASVRTTVGYGIRLTARQTEIMHLVASRGLSNKKIAQILNISESTVKVHISSILKAYGVRNRTQLALAGSSSGRL